MTTAFKFTRETTINGTVYPAGAPAGSISTAGDIEPSKLVLAIVSGIAIPADVVTTATPAPEAKP